MHPVLCSLCHDHVFPHVRILVLLLGLKRLGNTDGATLSICCLNASVSLAWTAPWHLPFSGMTSFGFVLGRTTRRWCCWRRFRPVVSLVLLRRLVLSRPCSRPGPLVPLAHEVAVFGSCRGVPAWRVICGVHPPAPDGVYVGMLSPACLVLRPCVVAPPTGRV